MCVSCWDQSGGWDGSFGAGGQTIIPVAMEHKVGNGRQRKCFLKCQQKETKKMKKKGREKGKVRGKYKRKKEKKQRRKEARKEGRKENYEGERKEKETRKGKEW